MSLRFSHQRRALTLVELLAALTLLSMVMGVVSAWTVGSARAQRAVARTGATDSPLDRALRLLARDIDEASAAPLRGASGEAAPSVVFDAEQDRVRVVAKRPLTGGAGEVEPRLIEWRLERSSDDVGLLVREETRLGTGQSGDAQTRTALRGVAAFEIQAVVAREQEPTGVRTVRARREPPKVVAYEVRAQLDGSDGVPVRTLRWEVVR